MLLLLKWKWLTSMQNALKNIILYLISRSLDKPKHTSSIGRLFYLNISCISFKYIFFLFGRRKKGSRHAFSVLVLVD